MPPGLTAFDAASILVVLAGLLGWINARFLKLPATVGLTAMGAIASLAMMALDRLLPASGIAATIARFLAGIDFRAALMDGMLSFLLFAGALHVDWSAMQRGRWPVLVLSTVGTLLSTLLVGVGFQLLAGLAGLALPLVWCLVFGALISPTDPVAVMGVMRRASVDPTLQATVAGESLFNDGIGIVVFSIILGTALGQQHFTMLHAAHLFAVEAGGGVLLGLAVGWLGLAAMREIDDYEVEVMISLGIVMGGYTLARWTHVSGPVAMAVAGLLIGNHGVAIAMSDRTRDYLLKFWTIVDDVLNAILFLLIGLQVLAIPAEPQLLLLGLAAIPLVLAARWASVMLPLGLMRPLFRLDAMAPMTLVWGGLRGGISVALALGLPEGPARAYALAATYGVVLFAVIVQGGSIARVLEWRERRLAR